MTSNSHHKIRISYMDQKIWKCSWHFLIFHIKDKRNIVNDFGNDKMLLVLVFQTLKFLVECLLIYIFCWNLKDQTTTSLERDYINLYVLPRTSHIVICQFFINFFIIVFLLRFWYIYRRYLCLKIDVKLAFNMKTIFTISFSSIDNSSNSSMMER